jgi:hypothetical protein
MVFKTMECMKLAQVVEGGRIMRSGSKRFMIGMGTFLIAAVMSAPSFAGKKAVSDDELDQVTAAGQPTVITVGTTSTVNFTGTASFTALNIQSGAQTALRALVLNNVLGENQVQTGVNIASSTAGARNQTNTITQSWGSLNDVTAVTVAGATVSGASTCNPGALICRLNPVVAAGNAALARLTQTADVIIDAGAGSTVTYNPTFFASQTITEGSQTDLVALVVNNVVGMNQVGNGVNIAASNTAGTPAVTVGPQISISQTGNTTAGNQGNTLQGYRGTPFGFTR